jgi:acetoin:2,6-dichlorophenolindophenol oxidoreductase subunit alpha
MDKLDIKLYQSMYLVRMTEEKIRQHYMEDEMKTPVHLIVGGEAIAAGVCHALGVKAQVYATYRSHSVYLLMTMETDKFFAELYGKETGAAKGKAGSMHLTAPDQGLLLTSAVVGTTIPLAVGTAYANLYRGDNRTVAVFFGDGAVDEGVFWESVNLACLKKLPVIFVCEDNGLAIHTSTAARHGYKSITNIVSQFNCDTYASASTDAKEIYNLTAKAIKNAQEKNRPAFLHLKYYRYYEHCGPNFDFKAGYRDEAEYQKWLKIDPLKLFREKLLADGINEHEIIKIEDQIKSQIDASARQARKDPFPQARELISDVYYE